jgi:hypothetical protein
MSLEASVESKAQCSSHAMSTSDVVVRVGVGVDRDCRKWRRAGPAQHFKSDNHMSTLEQSQDKIQIDQTAIRRHDRNDQQIIATSIRKSNSSI